MSACQPVDGACGGEPVTSRPVVPDGVTKIIVGPGQSGSTAVDRCLSPTGREDVDNGGQCTSRLSQLFNNSKFSDISLLVDDHCFYAHKLLLATASDVFEQMLTNEHWLDSGKRELVLQEPEDCVPVFADFLRYIYSGQVTLNCDTVLGLLVLADKYNVPDLKDCCCNYMSNHLVTPPEVTKAVTWYQYALACNSHQLQTACFSYIVLNMDKVIQSPDWVYLDRDNLITLLERSDLVVESEYIILQAVVRWLTCEFRMDQLKDNLQAILPYIRFPMILPEHLSEFEESEFEQQNHEDFSVYLLSAYRNHALSIKSKKENHGQVPATQFMYRNYTDENYAIHVDVVRKAFKSCPRVSSKVEKPMSLPLSICNVAQEKQCKMKVTFYPQGFYTTSLWNGQLNLAKSTDQTKLVIAHRGGLELSQAEVSVVVYAQQNGVKYASFAISAAHTFETYGSFEIENTIDTEQLKVEGSEFLLDGAVQVKVFVRPISFNRNSIN